jgi:small subunit ribosomal protein S4
MGRNLDPKCKQCRRVGEKMFLKGERCSSAKCALTKRNYPPGVHGGKGRTRQTEYGLQLQEKQKAMKEYRLLEKQFKLTFLKAHKLSGNVADNFLSLLETRLDNTVYRLNFAPSRDMARQLITHGHMTVNGKKVAIPSYQVKANDIIKIKDGSDRKKVFSKLNETLKKAKMPSWLYLNVGEMSGKVLNQPSAKDLITNINPQMIVEFYSR